jgi:hypothetical protein
VVALVRVNSEDGVVKANESTSTGLPHRGLFLSSQLFQKRPAGDW